MPQTPRGLSNTGVTPSDTRGGQLRAQRTARGLRGARLFSGPNVTRMGSEAPVNLRPSKAKISVSDSAKNMLNNGDYANDFARESKRINADMGMTRAQRKSQIGALKTRIGVESANLQGPAAEQALALSQQSTRRGLTRSQRTGLSDASETLLEASASQIDTDLASDFEQGLLKFFEV